MKKNIAFLLFATIACVNVYAQAGSSLQDFSAKATSKLKELQDKYPQEKMFLQSDKSQYLAGETIWMKAWCTLDGAPSFLSRTAYIELVNSNGDVVKKNMYRLDSMSSLNADVELPTSIASGTYTINAYTLWMLNFPEFIQRKHVFIYGEDYKRTKATATSPKRDIQMMFYPEGGDLVDGVKCRVAFKSLMKEDGQAVAVSGTITNNAGAKVADFVTEHEGMGVFEIDAVAGENYTANINTASGATMQFKLPAVKTNVISLRVENAGASRMFVLVHKPASMTLNKVRVVAQVNYQLVYSAELNLAEAQNATAIPKKNLPPGIAQITVFDENGTPLAERLAFIENYTVQKPALTTTKMVTGAKGKGQLDFTIDTKTPVALSALVVSADFADSVYTQENILSSLLMSSDLKGTVNKPAYYFADKDAGRLRKLDLLMMTQGWRRFEWKQVLDGSTVAALKYPVESSIVLKGKVTKPGNGTTPVTDGRVDFVIKGEDSTTMLAEAKLTDKGEFMVNDIHFKKAAMVMYQGTNAKKEKLVVDVNMYPMHIDSLKKSSLKPVLNLDTTDLSARNSAMSQLLYGQVMLMDTLVEGRGGYLGNVTVKTKKLSREDSLNRDYATGLFTMGKSVDPQQYANYNSIWKMIQVSVPGVRVEGDPLDPTVSFSRYDGVGGNFGENGVDEEGGALLTSSGIAYYINEINVSKDVVNSLILEDVALIKILRTEAAALGANQGAIAIYTKKGISAGKSVIDKSFTKIQMQGYALTREFYNTDYEVSGASKTIIDKRVTLFWNPHMRVAKDGKYHINFSNNDTGGKVKVVVQGIDKEGNIICTEQLVN